jgi:hypothetical protein
MSDPLDAIAASISIYKTWLAQPTHSDAAKHQWSKTISGLEAAAEELKRLRAWAKPVPARYGDLSDLPSDLIAQLSGVKTDELEDQIYATVKAAGDEIELDRLLIELFRRFGTVHERRFLNNKCYRMVTKGLIHQVRGRKGVYTVNVTREDAPSATTTDEPEEAV